MNALDDLTFDGITQPISEWAQDYGIPLKTIMRRLRLMWSVKKAITTPVRVRGGELLPADAFTATAPSKAGRAKRKPRLLYTIDGISLSKEAWAAKAGISSSTLNQRIAAGMTLADATARGRMNRRRATDLHTHHDGRSMTIAQWARVSGMPAKTIAYRVYKGGMSIGEAISTKSSLKRTIKLIVPIGFGLKEPKRLIVMHNGASITVTLAPTQGVPSDLPALVGTGGGRTAQESQNLEFSK